MGRQETEAVRIAGCQRAHTALGQMCPAKAGGYRICNTVVWREPESPHHTALSIATVADTGPGAPWWSFFAFAAASQRFGRRLALTRGRAAFRLHAPSSKRCARGARPSIAGDQLQPAPSRLRLTTIYALASAPSRVADVHRSGIPFLSQTVMAMTYETCCNDTTFVITQLLRRG
jgi:hypothetical protein